MDTVMNRLAAMLSAATADDLAELDAEIARLAALRDLLARALSGAAPSPNGDGKPPGKSAPAVRTRAPAPRGKGKSADAPAHRLAAARLLSTGSFGSTEIAKRADIPAGSVRKVLKHPWFEQEKPYGPYRLTAAGRLDLSAATAATAGDR